MQSFVDFERTFGGQPPRLGAVLSRIDVGRGREELYHDQVPELLGALAEETKVASISASNAIEGVVVDPDRAEQIAANAAPISFRNRNEQEFAGYRDAIDAITRAERQEQLTVPLILGIHRDLFRHTEARGGYLKTDDNTIVSYQKGYRETVFEPPPAARTEFFLSELVDRYTSAAADRAAHPVVLVSALILDVLAIHPVADGNGRVARILTTQQLLAQGYGVPRYVSVEQTIFETKNSYYDALYRSQRQWHSGEHSIWPWTEYLAGILADSYDSFEARVAASRGLGTLSKQERVRVWALEHAPASFRFRDARRALPGISGPTIRLVLSQLREEGLFEPSDEGPQSRWHRL